MSTAALSALLGAGGVGASHLVTLLVARATVRAEGPVAAPALALTYVVKVFVLGWVLFTVPAPAWLVPEWLAAGVLGALVASLVVAGASGARGTRTALEPVLTARRRAGTPHEEEEAPGGAGAPDDDRRHGDREHG